MFLAPDIRPTNAQMSKEFGRTLYGADDLQECIANIVLTIPGSVPGLPSFGCGLYEHIGLPIQQAAPDIAAAMREAVRLWETRVQVTSITWEIDIQGGAPSVLVFRLEWQVPRTGRAGSIDFGIPQDIAVPDAPVIFVLATQNNDAIITEGGAGLRV